MSQGSMGGRALDASKIEAAYVGFQTRFMDRLAKATPLYPMLTEVAETTNVLDRQLWLSNAPKMKRWVGPKQIAKFQAESMPIATQPYEASVEVGKHDILNDQLNLYGRRIDQMADGFGQAVDELVIFMLAAGCSVASPTAFGTTYDGQNLIDVDHTALSTGGTLQSNKVTGALSSTTYSQAIQAFIKFKDEQGVPIAPPSGRKKLVCGVANRDAARTLLGTEYKTDGTTNLDQSDADLIISPYIASGTFQIGNVSVTLTGLEWFVIHEGAAALLTQIKRRPEFLAVTEGEYAFRTGKYLYGTEAEFGAAYGLWQEIVGGPGA